MPLRLRPLQLNQPIVIAADIEIAVFVTRLSVISATAQGCVSAALCNNSRPELSVAEPQRTGRTLRATPHGAA
jgi:hypothetical protein